MFGWSHYHMRPYRLTHHRIDQDVPARTLGRGRPGKQIVHFPSLKNEGVIVCESRLEADFCLWLEYDRDVVSYRPQPETVSLIVDDKAYRYTPDVLAISFTGVEKIWEVKPHGVYRWPAYLRKMIVAEEYFAAQGRDFELVTDSVIRCQPSLRNLRWLYAQAHAIDPRAIPHLWDSLQGLTGPVTLGRLLNQAVPVSVRAIAHAVFQGQLAINLGEVWGPHSVLTIQEGPYG